MAKQSADKMLPMAVHKTHYIRLLESHPEELPQMFPHWEGTAQELIEAIKADPHDWFVEGKLTDLPKGR